MKRTTIYTSAVLALLLGLAACTQDDADSLPEGKYPIVIRATGLSAAATPASRATVDGNWQGVTSVALKVGDAVKEYTVTATDADEYKSATLSRENDPYYWTSRNDITVSAWWPFDADDLATMPDVKVADDQSTLAAFQKSDYIAAENQTVTFDAPKLTFIHRTARVTVELKPGGGIESVDGAEISLMSLSTANGNPSIIQPYNTSGNNYEALVAPQTVETGALFIRVKLDGDTFYFRPQNDVVLEAGYRYVYTIKVSATGLTLEGCTIGKWEPSGGESGMAEADLDYEVSDDGTTYTVYTATGLKYVANLVNSGECAINITLAKDIHLIAASSWKPVGTENRPYIGTFDGNEHTITGLYFVGSYQYAGLFGCIGIGGKVQNLTLENVNISGSGLSRPGYIGGVAGWNKGGTVTACNVSGNVTGNQEVGGVVGYNDINCTMTACYHISGSISGQDDTGGVVGYTGSNGTVTACYHASGSVSGGDKYTGSVAGYSRSTVTACYWSDSIDVGIGKNANDASKTTEVDGTNVTWQTAVDDMNAAIAMWNTNHPDNPCNWRYELTDGNSLPALKKNE